MLLGSFQFSILDWNEEVINWLIRALVSIVCGFAIGYERKARSKEAGIRTHSIVCLAACIMMIVSKYGFSDQEIGMNGVRGGDSARIAAQVVSGIGFLGSGIIFYKRDFLHGLTTAAGIWATAGIGLAIGAGMITIGVVSTIILVLLQIFLHRPIKMFKEKTTSVIKMSVVIDSPDTIDKIIYIFDVKKFLKFKTIQQPDGIHVDLEAATQVNFTPKELYEFTKTYDFIKTVEKVEEF